MSEAGIPRKVPSQVMIRAFKWPALWILLGYCGAFNGIAGRIAASNPSVAHGVFIAFWSSAYLLSLWGLRYAIRLGWLPSDLAFGALFGVAFMSAAWSELHAQTAMASVALGFSLLSSVLIAAYFPVSRTLGWIRKWVTIGCLISLLLYVTGHGNGGTDADLDRFNLLGWPAMGGVFEHKNILGFMGSIGLVLTLSARIGKWWKFVNATIISAAVFLSGSSGGLLIALLSVGLYIIIRATSRLMRISYLAVLAGALGIVVLAIQTSFGAIFQIVGRDASMTGRSNLREVGLAMFQSKPFLGWGYDGIIQGHDGPLYYFYSRRYYFPAHLQNDYIQYAAELGVVGLLLIAIIAVMAIHRAFSDLMKAPQSPLAAAQFVVLVSVLVEASVEHVLIGNEFGLFYLGLLASRGKVRRLVAYIRRRRTILLNGLLQPAGARLAMDLRP